MTFYIRYDLTDRPIRAYVSTNPPADTWHGLFHNSTAYDDTYGNLVPEPFATRDRAEQEIQRLASTLQMMERRLIR